MENYDPDNHFGLHVVELTFQQWEFKLTVEVVVKGNCKGFDIIDSAIFNFYLESCDEQGGSCVIYLIDKDGDELESCFDDDEELKDAVVSARILSFIKE